MRHLNKLATTFCAAVLGLFALTACEGGDLYNVNAPGWLQGKIDSIANNSEGPSYIDVIPNPATLGAVDNTTAWWSVFTDDVKAEPGETYQIKFTNYGGASNWNNFVIILRNGIASGEKVTMSMAFFVQTTGVGTLNTLMVPIVTTGVLRRWRAVNETGLHGLRR